MTSQIQAKQNMETLPVRMRDLPLDERGYTVPWFVDWIDGKPEFRAMDLRKFVRAIKEKLCWVCGSRLGVNLCFVAGPMCGINRTSSEPPCHAECGRWSAQNCPFLSNPRMVRREDEQTAEMAGNVAGFAIRRNPGVSMLWFCRDYSVFDDGRGGKLINMGEPDKVEWWAEGRIATREEVQRSIDSGLPALEAMARTEKGAMEVLVRTTEQFQKWLPA